MPDPPRFKPPVITPETREKVWAEALAANAAEEARQPARDARIAELDQRNYEYALEQRKDDKRLFGSLPGWKPRVVVTPQQENEAYAASQRTKALAEARERNVQAALKAINPESNSIEDARRQELATQIRTRMDAAEAYRAHRDPYYGSTDPALVEARDADYQMWRGEPIPNQKTETSGLPPVPVQPPSNLLETQSQADNSIPPEEVEFEQRKADAGKVLEDVHQEHPIVKFWKTVHAFHARK